MKRAQVQRSTVMWGKLCGGFGLEVIGGCLRMEVPTVGNVWGVPHSVNNMWVRVDA